MRYFPAALSRTESDALYERIRLGWEQNGFDLWAVERREDTSFIGFIGLSVARFDAHFTPCVEIGWRLVRSAWGCGLATEGASRALEFGFSRLGLGEIVAFTAATNLRSRRVMERLGMRRDPRDDFEHPLVPEGHPLRPHVLHRLRRPT